MCECNRRPAVPSISHSNASTADRALTDAHDVIVNLNAVALAELLLVATAGLERDERTITARLAAIELARRATP